MRITIVQSYTKGVTSLLLSVLLRVHRTSNNAYGNKWVRYFNHTVCMSRVLSYVNLWPWEALQVYTQLMFLLRVCASPYQVLQVVSGTTTHTCYAWICNEGSYDYINYHHNNQSGFVVTESDQKLADGRPLTFTFFTQNCSHLLFLLCHTCFLEPLSTMPFLYLLTVYPSLCTQCVVGTFWSDIGQHQHSLLYARRVRGCAAISGDRGLHHFPAETSE